MNYRTLWILNSCLFLDEANEIMKSHGENNVILTTWLELTDIHSFNKINL